MPAILLVEDEEFCARDLMQNLAAIGHEVVGLAAGGEEAVRMAMELGPDLILMDIGLRGAMDGIKTARVIQQQIDVPVVYLTAHADFDALERAKVTLPYGFLLKPCQREQLHAAIQVALHKHDIERRLIEHEHWLSTTLRSIGEGVIATDAERRVVLWNTMAETLTGWRRGETIGRPLSDVFRLIDEREGSAVPCPAGRAASAGVTTMPLDSLLVVPRQGDPFPIEGCVTQMAKDWGGLLGHVLVFRDISDRRYRDQERARLTDELSRAVTIREQFLSVASHELRTPLTTLDLAAQGLTRALARLTGHPGADQALKRAERIERTTKDLDRLIENLLDVSRLLAGRLEISREEVDLVALAREVADRFDEQLQECGSQLSLRLPQSLLLHLDRMRLDQVLTNLLSNAIKYGQGRPIDLALERSDESWFIHIADQGIGVRLEDQERIFLRFERAASIRHYGGLGLGLWITRQLVETMHGSISVKSTLGAGSTFSVELPILPADRDIPRS